MFVIIKEEDNVDGSSEMCGVYGPFDSIDDPEIKKVLVEAGYIKKRDKIKAGKWYFKSLFDSSVVDRIGVMIWEVKPAFTKVPKRTENNLL